MIGTIEGKNTFTHSEIPDWIVNTIGKYTSIAEGVFFHNNDNHYCVENKKYVSSYDFKKADQPRHIVIGNDVWIGRGASILTGIQIGDGAIVGAYSVVTKDVLPYSVIVGNPGVLIKLRFTKDQIEKLLKIKWWNWEDQKVQDALNAGDFEDIEKFIQKYD